MNDLIERLKRIEEDPIAPSYCLAAKEAIARIGEFEVNLAAWQRQEAIMESGTRYRSGSRCQFGRISAVKLEIAAIEAATVERCAVAAHAALHAPWNEVASQAVRALK
jgi:hypothetical protein